MSRELSYSWYPKDWTYSDSTFGLTLAERGAYRELIDLAMMNNNNVKIEWETWVRKWNTDEIEITDIVSKLVSKGLVKLNGDNLFIPSCERRLAGKRNGSIGGQSTANGTPNGTANDTPKEKEKEKEKENISVKKHRFTPPELKEVALYFVDKGSTVNEAQKFHGFYESKGWMVGKNKMKSWKAAASGWLARNKEDESSNRFKPQFT